jgi:hypothetical protein
MLLLLVTVRSRGSSVSIVSDYGLDDRSIEVRSRQRRRDFYSNLSVQTGSGAHPASCTMGTGGPFPGGKARPGRDADHSPPSSAEVVNEWELYLLSYQAPLWRVAGLLYFFTFFTVHCYGVVLHKAFQAVRPLLMYCAFPIWVLFIPVSPITAVWQHPTETPVAKQEKLGEKMAVNFFDELSLSYSARFLTCRKSYDMGPTPLLSLRKKCVTDFYRPWNPSSLPGFEPANLGSNCKHDNF